MLDAINRGDRTAWLASLDEDYEITLSVTGRTLVRFAEGEAGWDFYRDVAQTLGIEMGTYAEFVDAGATKVLAHPHAAAHGQRSGAGVEFDYWLVITFREGKILREVLLVSVAQVARWHFDQRQAAASN